MATGQLDYLFESRGKFGYVVPEFAGFQNL